MFAINLKNYKYLKKEGITKEFILSPKELRALRNSGFETINNYKKDEAENKNNISPLLTHHPFNNKCKFPVPNIYAPDIYNEKLAERRRQIECNITDPDYATMDSEGFIYVHPHFVHYPKFEKNINCKVIIIEGGLRQPDKKMNKNMFKEIKTFSAPENVRFWVNANVFIIKCFSADNEKKVLWKKPFAGMIDSSIPKNELLIVKDLPSFGKFGNKIRKRMETKSDRFSIDILGFDSTSRTMFMRHLPRTVETMNKLGYHFFYGYNKVADNSMVNLLPILVGDLDEALKKPKHDASGDINIDSILPQNDNLDPTNLKFLWKMMEEKWGCKSMFNEDISMQSYGLFNYPKNEFQEGFRENPADHYYRAYFLAVYENWKYAPCKDGDTVQKEFVNLWKRFANQYKNICHFGFSFITTLTHEDGSVLEILDEKLSEDLSSMQVSGALDNTLSIIMGDHGNRIGAIQWTYTGRIEERMPLMAIKLPKGFAQKYPDEYNNFIKNKYKLVGNFDIHKTLFDIATMRFGENKNKIEADTGRGISLFEEISNERTCRDIFVPENFCTCLVDVSKVQAPLKGYIKIDDETQKNTSLKVLKNWIKSEKVENCIKVENLVIENNFTTLSLNQFARHGLRSKSNVTENEKTMKLAHKLNFVNLEFEIHGNYQNGDDLKMLTRIEFFYEKNLTQIVFEPFMITFPESCNFTSIFDICECLEKK